MAKLGPFRIGENKAFRIGKTRTFSDWQTWDLSGLAKIGPFRIGENRTLPDWDHSGFVKIAFPGLLKISPETLPDTVSESIMLYELARKGVFRP